MTEELCIVCGSIEWATVCPTCAAQGWTEKAVLQGVVDALRKLSGG